MRIRIQPRDIDVPANDPFQNDLLDRKESVKVLTHLVSSFEGPCVLAVDAAWGNGKTTFLKIWTQYLRNQEFPVVKFNAWETDFSGDPFVALSTELTNGLKEYSEIEDQIEKTKTIAKEVLRRAVPGLIRVVTAGVLDVSPPLGNKLGSALASYAEARLSEYQEAQKSVEKFRRNLEKIAGTLAKLKNRPLIVVIDELDRCRPSYAVELLEVAKHLFAVDRIVFVLAVNRSELAHSIKALYGNEFDAHGYLRRFIDIGFRLPDPDRNKFIDAALCSIKIKEYFNRTKDDAARNEYQGMHTLLQSVFGDPGLSLRQVGQAIHRLGLVFASLRSNARSLAVLATVALIFRTIDEDLYHRFRNGEVSDLEAVDRLIERLGETVLPFGNPRSFLEAILILGAHEISQSSLAATDDTPLLKNYKKVLNPDSAEDKPSEQEKSHAQSVVDWVRKLSGDSRYGRGIGFAHAVERIELLSDALIEESG